MNWDELADLQNNALAAIIHGVKHQFMWLSDEIQEKYSKLADKAAKLILRFPSTYLVDSAFSIVTVILIKKHSSLNILGGGE